MQSPRRDVLRTVSALGVVAVAGCASNEGSTEETSTDGDASTDGASSGGDGDTETETETETETGADERDVDSDADENADETEDETGGDFETEASWPLRAHDRRNSSYAPQLSGPSGDLERRFRWSYQLPEDATRGNGAVSSLVAAGERVVGHVSSAYGVDDDWDRYSSLVAIDATTGDLVWELETTPDLTPTVSTPAIADGLIYHPFSHSRAIDPTDGTERWTSVEPPIPMGPATIADGTLFVPAGRLATFDLADGTLEWETEQAGIRQPPAITGDLVLASSGSDVVAFERTTGDERWRTEHTAFLSEHYNDQPGQLHAPVVGDDTVFAAAGTRAIHRRDSGGLAAFDLETGDERWTVDLPEETGAAPTGLYGLPSLADGTLYVNGWIDGESALFAIDAESGARRWRRETDGIALFSPTDGDTVYVASENAVEAFDVPDGTRLERRTLSDGTHAVDRSPALLDGVLVVPGSHSIFGYGT